MGCLASSHCQWCCGLSLGMVWYGVAPDWIAQLYSQPDIYSDGLCGVFIYCSGACSCFYEWLFAIIHHHIGVCAVLNQTFATSDVWSMLYFTGYHYLNLEHIGLFAVAKLER